MKFGLVIHVLKTPTKADLDDSGTISVSEAALLGLALSLDAIGAGIGASLIGLKQLITSLVIGLMNFIFILLGMKLGFIFSNIHWMQRFSYVPGMILILIGILKILI